jgi:hypothetical protein
MKLFRGNFESHQPYSLSSQNPPYNLPYSLNIISEMNDEEIARRSFAKNKITIRKIFLYCLKTK